MQRWASEGIPVNVFTLNLPSIRLLKRLPGSEFWSKAPFCEILHTITPQSQTLRGLILAKTAENLPKMIHFQPY